MNAASAMIQIAPATAENGMNPNHRELTAHQRAARVMRLLLAGETLSTSQIAEITYLTWAGAHYMMTMISATEPITQDGDKWIWLRRS